MRNLLFVVLAGLALIADSASAEEPLFLRIRPNADQPEASGAGWSAADDVAAARARALREAVWARSDRRARIAIASVCTGCLKPLASSASRAATKADRAVTEPLAVPPRPAALFADSR